MGEINWTPELIARTRRNIEEYRAEAEREQLIGDVLSEHADAHYRRALTSESTAARYEIAINEHLVATGETK